MITQADLDRAYNHILQAASLEFEGLKNQLGQPAPTGVRLKTALHRYLVTGPKPTVDYYDLQRWADFRRTDFPATSEVYLYISTAEVTGDKEGWTWPLPPGQIKDAYRAHRADGLVTRGTGNDVTNLLNLANPDLISTIVKDQLLVMQITHADGVYLDEVDQTWEWGYPGMTPREFPTIAEWQVAMANLVEKLAAGLQGVGKKLWINLGADYSATNPWQKRLISAADGINIEHFIGREAVGQPPSTTATDWVSQVGFLRDVEWLGKAVHVHCSSSKQSVVDYAYVSWLLGTEFRGSFTASGLIANGSSDYSGTLAVPTPSLVASATALGTPYGPFVTQGSALRTRTFAKGALTVNPTPGSILGMGPRTWRFA